MKFKVGDRVKALGTEMIIDEIYPVSYCVKDSNGVYWPVEEDELELIQEKEQVMKFKVGDKVTCAYEDTTGVVVSLGPTGLINVKWNDEEIRCYGPNALKLVQPEVQEPVVEDPTPGKYYRTRGGDKIKFIAKASSSYLYEHEDAEDGFNIHEFDGPYRCVSAYETGTDIVGEWVDEEVLPAVEIKRWVKVQKIADIWPRGNVIAVYEDKDEAEDDLNFNEEIVELTGTLPERKI